MRSFLYSVLAISALLLAHQLPVRADDWVQPRPEAPTINAAGQGHAEFQLVQRRGGRGYGRGYGWEGRGYYGWRGAYYAPYSYPYSYGLYGYGSYPYSSGYYSYPYYSYYPYTSWSYYNPSYTGAYYYYDPNDGYTYYYGGY